MKIIYRCLIIITIAVPLASCGSPWSFLKPSSGLEVDTEIVAGDKDQELNVGSDTINAETINHITELPWYYIVLLCILAGWAIPSPMEMFRGLINGIRLAFGKAPL